MNEIKQRAERARQYRQFIDRLCNLKQRKWCIYLGLWETSILVGSSSGFGLRVFRWLETGERHE